MGEPVEVFLTPGATAAVGALNRFAFAVPEGSTVVTTSKLSRDR